MGGREVPDKEHYIGREGEKDFFSLHLPKLRTAGPAQDGAFKDMPVIPTCGPVSFALYAAGTVGCLMPRQLIRTEPQLGQPMRLSISPSLPW